VGIRRCYHGVAAPLRRASSPVAKAGAHFATGLVFDVEVANHDADIFRRLSTGAKMAAVNVRCVDGIDVDALKVKKVDGRSL
jgi:hypothetical protein